MFADFETADIIAYWCALVDNDCRKELRLRRGAPGIIKDERDYVSALSKGIRDKVSLRYQCSAETIERGAEIENGVDGLFLFQCGDEVKVGWYEAKWPRVLQTDYHWDRTHSYRSISHFTEQIIKQSKRTDTLAIWEMFFNEADDGYESPPYVAYGSSCVWHEHAYEFMKSQGIIFDRWKTENLKILLNLNCVSFYSVIYDVISCRKGKKLKINKATASVTIPNPREPESTLDIPLPEPIESVKDDNNNSIRSFMQKNNIAGYLHVNLEKQKKHE